MNDQKRKQLREALFLLSEANKIVLSIMDREQDDLDNLPENFQETERYEAMENGIDSLNNASDNISQAWEDIYAVIEG